jgi:hypothetical protein
MEIGSRYYSNIFATYRLFEPELWRIDWRSPRQNTALADVSLLQQREHRVYRHNRRLFVLTCRSDLYQEITVTLNRKL